MCMGPYREHRPFGGRIGTMVWAIDIVVVIFVLYSTYQGFRSKAGTQFWALVALVVALWGGILFTTPVAATLSFLQDEAVRKMVAFLIVFLILHQGIQFLTATFKLNFSVSGLDPILGALFALIESSLFAGVLGYAAMSVPAFRLTVEQTVLLSKLSSFAGSLVAAFGGKGLL